MEFSHRPSKFYEKCFKRLLDCCCALSAMVLFSWLYVIIAILVRVKLGSPVIFVQERPGKDEKIFNLYKFRTMTNARGENGELLPDECRLTKFGKFLRESSLDELPELWNILKGDMSLVGPRPLLVQYLPRYRGEQKRRHEIRPGLSGWAQVNGRNAMTWEEKFRHDVWYVDHVSFALDVKILFLTVLTVLKRDGISSEGQATTEEFWGTESNIDLM